MNETPAEFINRKLRGIYHVETSLLDRMDDTLKDMRRYIKSYKECADIESLNDYKISLIRLDEQTTLLQILYESDKGDENGK